MRILALSLLRLGDLFHHVHLLREIKRRAEATTRTGSVELHVLAFTDTKAAEKLFPEFRFHFIPRAELQTELVERHRSWRRALQLLKTSIRDLNEYDFTQTYNLTHTSFSGRIMDLLECPEKKGLRFEDGRAVLDGQGLRYVNEIWAFEKEPLFNWIDATAASVDTPEPPIMAADARERGEVWLQPLTSDSKKNWSIPKWRELARRLRAQNTKFRFIAAPGEGALLATALGEDVYEMTFQALRETREHCALLVAGDTSVLHFAVLEKIPVMGIYLGPANPFKTPPRQKGAGIWWSPVGCSPCGHRSTCSQATHACEEALGAEEVELAILAKLKKIDIGSHLTQAHALYGEVQSFGRVHFRRNDAEAKPGRSPGSLSVAGARPA
ncbi:MAG: glycosyltransferase family 9 protein [Bdellovibrionaceae bacterium]|nr:glycosyltransferase family 9 protein [Pseudobdellovibrionaceae bacterium]